MNPRAAWRLEAARFGPVFDYAAGKADWLADDQPFEGTARPAGTLTRRGVATAAEGTTAANALRLLDAQGFGPVLVIDQAGVVMGAAYRDKLAAAAGEAEVGTATRFGVSTVRPSEDAAALARRMGDRGRHPGGSDPSRRDPDWPCSSPPTSTCGSHPLRSRRPPARIVTRAADMPG